MNKKDISELNISFDQNKNCFKAQIAVGYYENGRIKRKTVYGATEKEVKQKLRQIEIGIYTGTYVEESSITIKDLALQTQQDKLDYGDIKSSTYHRNSETIKMLSDIYMTPIQKADEFHLKRFLLSKTNYSQSSLNKMHIMLSMVFKEAVKRKIINENPMAEVRKPKSKKRTKAVRALTVDEQAKLMKILQIEDVKYSLQMLLSMLTGMRIGEINALMIKDISLESNTININKTISRGPKGEAYVDNTPKTEAGKRTILISDNVKMLLQDYLRVVDDGYLFTTEKGGLITTNQVNMELSRLLKKHDIVDKTVSGKITAHSLRHTYATRCIEGGMSAKVLQTLLGHTDVRVTLNTYCNAFDQFQSENISKVDSYMQNLGLTLDKV